MFVTFLYTTKTGHSGKAVIRKGDFMIGRGGDCHLRIPFPEVSRQHCRIRFNNNQVSFADVRASSVGILHNGKYKKAGLLNPGDECFIGDTRLVLVEYGIEGKDADASIIIHDFNQIRLEDEDKEAPAVAETLVGTSLVGGHAGETHTQASWCDMTALSIAAQKHAPAPKKDEAHWISVWGIVCAIIICAVLLAAIVAIITAILFAVGPA